MDAPEGMPSAFAPLSMTFTAAFCVETIFEIASSFAA